MFPLLASAYSRLPDSFFRPVNPTPTTNPQVVLWNSQLASELGIQGEAENHAALLSGNTIFPGVQPIATAYAGHQFGHFVPQLGDGRAILIGETAGWEIQLKGAGRTPFSRGGDGRSALGPAIREFLASEAMHALGIPTTRALAVTLTGEQVYRDRPVPGAVFTRVARSHIRVGTFQYFAARGDVEAVRALADHLIANYLPANENYRNLFLAIRDSQAALIARWMQAGFIHGVMNTDNMSALGDTIDYGPCAFMDTFDPGTVYSAIDQDGRYAYANQPSIAAWNLARLAETLLDLIDPDRRTAIDWAQEAVHGFPQIFHAHWLCGMKAKVGLAVEHPDDEKLIEELLEAMHLAQLDFTLTFRTLANSIEPGLEPWLQRWRERLKLEHRSPEEIAAAMRRVNPAYILRNHRVEWAIDAAVNQGDFSKAIELQTVLSKPFEEQPEFAHYRDPPQPGAWKCQTFCGT